MSGTQIQVELILCPDRKLRGGRPDDSWPRPSGVTVRFRKAGARKADAVEVLTDVHGVATSQELDPGTYNVTVVRGEGLKDWGQPQKLPVTTRTANQPRQIKLVPKKDNRLLPFLLTGETQAGKLLPLVDAMITIKKEKFRAFTDGRVYALVQSKQSRKSISVQAQLSTVSVGGQAFDPPYKSITLDVPRLGTRNVDVPAIVYFRAEAEPQKRGISVRPEIELPRGSGVRVPLTGATVTVRRLSGSTTTDVGSKVLVAGEKSIHFPNLDPAVYTVLVAAPRNFDGWPLSVPPQEIGPHYLSASDLYEKTVRFDSHIDQLSGVIKVPGGGSVDGELQLVIFGPDASVPVTVTNHKFTTTVPSKAPLQVQLAPGSSPAIDGIPLELLPAVQDVSPPPGETTVTLQYKHGIEGYAFDEDGNKLPGAVIVVFKGSHDIATAVADDTAYYLVGVPGAGKYDVALQTDGGEPVTRETVTVQSVYYKDVHASSGRTAAGRGRESAAAWALERDGEDLRQLPEAFTDLAAYPVLTEEITTTGVPAPSGGGGPGAGYGQTVDQVIRDVLGWRPTADVSGFQAALAGAFALKEVEGHTEWTWQQRGYAVQADLGALTGAQASIYARAKGALDQMLPLLTGLTAIDPALYPPRDLEAIRTVVTSELNELVTELALEGGPRIERVDQLFTLLLGVGVTSRNLNPDTAQGNLGTLRDRFGLTAAHVETIEEERIVTDFRIVAEQLLALHASWTTDKGLLSVVGRNSSLGTVLIWLSRALEAVCESVNDLTFALDSVFVDAAQRQVIELRLGDRPPLLLSDLLDWVVRASRDEGPRIIQDAGKDGVLSFASVLTTLRDLIRQTLNLTRPSTRLPAGMRPVPDGLRTPRVNRAIQVLASQLDEAARLAGLVQRDSTPEITALGVRLLHSGEVQVDLYGVNFRRPASAFLFARNREDIPDIRARHVRVKSPSDASACFRVPPRELGDHRLRWQVVLVNADGTPTDPVDLELRDTHLVPVQLS
jgi:hypothetical protein